MITALILHDGGAFWLEADYHPSTPIQFAHDHFLNEAKKRQKYCAVFAMKFNDTLVWVNEKMAKELGYGSNR